MLALEAAALCAVERHHGVAAEVLVELFGGYGRTGGYDAVSAGQEDEVAEIARVAGDIDATGEQQLDVAVYDGLDVLFGTAFEVTGHLTVDEAGCRGGLVVSIQLQRGCPADGGFGFGLAIARFGIRLGLSHTAEGATGLVAANVLNESGLRLGGGFAFSFLGFLCSTTGGTSLGLLCFYVGDFLRHLIYRCGRLAFIMHGIGDGGTDFSNGFVGEFG